MKKMCDKDCFNCKYVDCRLDGVDRDEYMASRKRDVDATEMPTDITDNRKFSVYKYNHSEKRKVASDKYNHSEKGIIARKKGVNAYYQRNREQILATYHEYYKANKDRINARKRERRRLAKLAEKDLQNA